MIEHDRPSSEMARTGCHERTSVNPYIEAARPRTLPAAVAPVAVGTAASAAAPSDLSWIRAGLALLVALALQVAVNYANDYFDGVRGIDTEARVGPRRAVASGLITPAAMRQAMVVALVVGALGGVALAAMAGWELLLVGAAALLATLGYSGGSKPYASAGLGEVAVFLFFGVVATVGSAYVQDETITLVPVLASVPMGTFAMALLVVNNLRDVPTDAQVGKRTLAVRLGEDRTRMLYLGLVAVGYLALVPLVVEVGSGWVALPLVSVVGIWPALAIVRRGERGTKLIAALAMTARAQLLYAALLTTGLVIA